MPSGADELNAQAAIKADLRQERARREVLERSFEDLVVGGVLGGLHVRSILRAAEYRGDQARRSGA